MDYILIKSIVNGEDGHVYEGQRLHNVKIDSDNIFALFNAHYKNVFTECNKIGTYDLMRKKVIVMCTTGMTFMRPSREIGEIYDDIVYCDFNDLILTDHRVFDFKNFYADALTMMKFLNPYKMLNANTQNNIDVLMKRNHKSYITTNNFIKQNDTFNSHNIIASVHSYLNTGLKFAGGKTDD